MLLSKSDSSQKDRFSAKKLVLLFYALLDKLSWQKINKSASRYHPFNDIAMNGEAAETLLDLHPTPVRAGESSRSPSRKGKRVDTDHEPILDHNSTPVLRIRNLG
jgi:hypothetical protein